MPPKSTPISYRFRPHRRSSPLVCDANLFVHDFSILSRILSLIREGDRLPSSSLIKGEEKSPVVIQFSRSLISFSFFFPHAKTYYRPDIPPRNIYNFSKSGPDEAVWLGDLIYLSPLPVLWLCSWRCYAIRLASLAPPFARAISLKFIHDSVASLRTGKGTGPTGPFRGPNIRTAYFPRNAIRA